MFHGSGKIYCDGCEGLGECCDMKYKNYNESVNVKQAYHCGALVFYKPPGQHGFSLTHT